MKQISFFEVPTGKSPLSYVGSKAKLIPYLDPYLSVFLKDKQIVSPFVGGGSIE